VTPYTAFLAIPAREVTVEAARTLDAARAQRQQAQARHRDATALTSGGDAAGGGDVYAEAEEAAWDDAAPLPDAPMRADGGSAGCASCSVGAERGTSAGLLLAPLVALALLWRRRRAA